MIGIEMFKELISGITKLKQYKSIVYLVLGSAISLILPLSFSPILARIYSVHDFAVYGFLQSLIVPLSAIACARYELSVVTAKSENKAVSGVYLSYFISLILTVIVFICFYLFKFPINGMFESQMFIQVWAIAPLFILIQGIYIVNNFWLQRVNAFKQIAINKIIQHSSIAVASLIFGLVNFKYGLIWGFLIGWVIIDIVSLFQFGKLKFNFGHFSLFSIKNHAIKNYEYPLYNAIPAFLFYVTVNIPTFLIAKHYSSIEVGFFTLTKQVLSIPTSMLAGAISQVIFQKISSMKNKRESILPEFKRIITFLILFAIFLISVLLPFGKTLFVLLFGEKWAVSGVFTQILVISVAMQFICSSLINILVALGKIKLASLWQTGYFVCIFVLFFIEIIDVKFFLKIYAAMDFVCYSVYLILILSTIFSYERSLTGSNKMTFNE